MRVGWGNRSASCVGGLERLSRGISGVWGGVAVQVVVVSVVGVGGQGGGVSLSMWEGLRS